MAGFIAAANAQITDIQAEVIYTNAGAPQVMLTWTLASGDSVLVINRCSGEGCSPETATHLNAGLGTAGAVVDTMVETGQIYFYRIANASATFFPAIPGLRVVVGTLEPAAATIDAPASVRPGDADNPAMAQLSGTVAGTSATYTFGLTAVQTTPSSALSAADLADELVLQCGAAAASGTKLQCTNALMLSFTAPALTQTINGAEITLQSIALTFTLAVTASGSSDTAAAVIVIGNPSGGDAVDNAVLPNVLRGITQGVHGGILQRIQQRQQQDGRWK